MLWLPAMGAQDAPWGGRGMDILTEDQEHTDIDNESSNSSDATVTLGGPEAEGHSKDPVYDNQEKLTALIREINDLHQ